MVHGEVAYKHHAGHEAATEWAASMNPVEDEGQLKVSRYHIIVVGFPLPVPNNTRPRGRVFAFLLASLVYEAAINMVHANESKFRSQDSAVHS